MAGLDLIPNEIVGYRIRPDWYSYNVVIVKKHGAGSKKVGQEYEKPLGYFKNLHYAANFIFEHALRTRGELAQDEQQAVDGTVASVEALMSQIAAAKADVQVAVDELSARIDQLSMTQKELVKALGGANDSESADAPADAA